MRRLKEWVHIKASDFIEYNPREILPKNRNAKKVAMERLLPFTRTVSGFEVVPYNGGAKFRNGDTIMARITPCLENGKTAQIDCLEDNEIGFGSTEFIVMRERPEISDKDFVYYLATNPSFREIAIRSMVGSSGRQRVQQSVLDSMELYVPPLKEQKAIARALRAFDDKIKNNNKINHHLEQMAQAIFKSWFVDFEPFGGKMPKGWQDVKLGDICECVLGGTPSRKRTDYWNGNIPWINSGETNRFRITSPSEYITKQGLQSSATKLLPSKTVVLAITGATLGQISVLEIASCTNQSVVGIIPNEIFPYEFIYPAIKEKINYLLANKTGGAQQHINKQNVEDIPVILPGQKVIKNYQSTISPIYDAIADNCFENERLAELRDALLPRLMSGELSVADIDAK